MNKETKVNTVIAIVCMATGVILMHLLDTLGVIITI
jgi:hypothetical protein